MDYDPDEVDSVEELEFQDFKSIAQIMPPKSTIENNFSNGNKANKKTFSSLFACFGELDCIEDNAQDPHVEDTDRIFNKTAPTSSTLSNTLYTSITPIPYQERIINLESKKPTWNSELRQFTHFFGGRVKIPSYRNFMVMQVSSNSDHCQSAVETSSDRVCIRHGQVMQSIPFY